MTVQTFLSAESIPFLADGVNQKTADRNVGGFGLGNIAQPESKGYEPDFCGRRSGASRTPYFANHFLTVSKSSVKERISSRRIRAWAGFRLSPARMPSPLPYTLPDPVREVETKTTPF